MSIRYSTSMFLGETTRGMPQPVFYDPHTALFNNTPPATVIFGAPGSGKTHLAMTLAAISSVLGKTTIVLDPKGDFLSLISLQDEIGDVKIWNLTSGTKGLLDPVYMAETASDRLSLIISTITMLLGEVSGEELGVLSPLVKDVLETTNPSLMKVLDELKRSRKELARDIGNRLDMMSRLRFAELCFAPGGTKRSVVDFRSGTTIITMNGLELNKRDSAGGNNSSISGQHMNRRLSETVFYLVTDYIRRVMNDDTSDRPKTVIIDEAWAVLSTEPGAAVISQLTLLGRSKKLATIIITQSSSHLDGIDIDNTITTYFAFKTDLKDAEKIVKTMGLPENEGFAEALAGLSREDHEILMRDWRERYAVFAVNTLSDHWNNAFSTNPLEILQRRNRAKTAK